MGSDEQASEKADPVPTRYITNSRLSLHPQEVMEEAHPLPGTKNSGSIVKSIRDAEMNFTNTKETASTVCGICRSSRVKGKS